MKAFLLFLVLSAPVTVLAQFTYALDDSIPVHNADNNLMEMPWAGGLNAAQYNTMDLNHDGKDDLVLFDRMANKVIPFINENNQYKHAPSYEALFPSDVSNFLLLRDYNCDGKKDIFTGDVLGIKVYTNITPAGANLSWERFLFYAGTEDKSPVLLSMGFSDLVNVQLQYDDLPAINDIDGDGDLDLLNMRYAANGTIEYHKNMSQENYGNCDSLEFIRVTQTWGSLKECTCGVFTFDNTDCPPQGGRTEHAGGKSLLVLDTDGDGDLDLLFSEASCTRLYLLENKGTSDAPVFDSSNNFPLLNSINFYIFPGAFYEDVDFDGVKDLIATPNIFAKTYFNTNLSASNWLYKNSGTTSSPDFSLVKQNFLQDKMIDVGDNAVPAFADFDGDGDLDMFISNHASDNYEGTIAQYENVGTRQSPEFRLVTNDYLGFSSFDSYNLKINFSDINADGKTDLVFTATSHQTNTTNLYYLPNKNNGNLNFGGQSPTFIDIDISYSDNLCVTDVDLDGKPDLLIGSNTGALEYWKNDGALNFTLYDPQFLDVSSSIIRQNPACATGDLNGDGKTDLIIGDQSGIIQIINDFRSAANTSGSVSQIVYNPITGTYLARNMGGRIWPTIANLYGTDKPAIVTGDILGGIQILKNDNGRLLPDDAQIKVFPNPTPSLITVWADRQVSMRIFSSLGQEVQSNMLINANENFTLDISSLSKGTYIFQFTYAGAPEINYKGTPHVTSGFPALLLTPFALLSDGFLNHTKTKTVSFRIVKI